ncbi:carbohydrate ABC transporter permease [Longispora albida]|uniref:carbohydrate ABC transporter permease n=1 Tax=Longispora albida TaxID=203523 RepID=UPI000372ACAF|nr:sugar ABC transporter permease [Longispora albida]
MRHGKYRFVAGFLALPVLLYVFYVWVPFGYSFYFSLTRYRGTDVPPVFVGLDNFTTLFTDTPEFWKALTHNGVILLIMPLVTIVIALIFAFFLNVGGKAKGGVTSGVRGSKFYRLVFFFPQLLALPIVAVLFQSIYRPDDSGLINGALNKLGLPKIGFLIDTNIALLSIIAVMVWQAVGFYVVLFSAGMSSIPKEIYEAADLDGASRWTMFYKVTLPLLWDNIQVGWVYLGIAAFDVFALVDVLSVNRGGPSFSTTVLSMEVVNKIGAGNYGMASAMGVMLFFCTLTFAAISLRVTKRESIEY